METVSIKFSQFLSMFSYLSLLSSFIYFVLLATFSYHLKSRLAVILLNTKILQGVLFYIFIISRKFCALPMKSVKEWSIISAILLGSSTCLRFSIICGFTAKNTFVMFIIVFFYFVFFINTIFRISVSLGSFIDFQYPHIVLTFWESWEKHHENDPGYFKKFTSPQAPRPSPPSVQNVLKPELLKRYGIVIAALSLPFIVYSSYELHHSRIATERGADAAERAADAAAVQAGLMPPNAYHERWPKSEISSKTYSGKIKNKQRQT